MQEGGRLKWEEISILLMNFIVQWKLRKHFKAIILQLKKEKKKKILPAMMADTVWIAQFQTCHTVVHGIAELDTI